MLVPRLKSITIVAVATTVAALAALVLVAGPARAHQLAPADSASGPHPSFTQEAAARLGAAQVDAMYEDAPAAVRGHCTRTVDVPGQGSSCRLAGGLWGVRLHDGTTVSTHGPDFLAASTPVLSSTSALGLSDAGDLAGHPDDSAFVACSSDPTQPRYRAIYARRSGSSADANLVVSGIRAALRQASQFTRDQSVLDMAPPGGEARMRFACTPGNSIDVRTVTVSSASSIDIASLESQLTAAGANAGPDAPTTRMVVYYDGANTSRAAGQGSIFVDDVASTANQNNSADAIAVQYDVDGTPHWNVFVHEMMHNMGATQDGAPGANGHGHCTEDADIMCYDEYGVHTHANPACTTTQLDCGSDTYFNANPTPTGWLATHWNAGSPLNRWLDFGTRNLDTMPPSVPSLPRILDTTETSAHVAWDASTDQSPLVTYRTYVRASGGAVGVTSVGSETSTTIAGLTPGGQYFVRVDATDAAGNVSPPGPEQSVTLPATPARQVLLPATPVRLAVDTAQQGARVTTSSPTQLLVGGIQGSRATLSWSTGATGGTPASFRIVLQDETAARPRTMTVAGSDHAAVITLAPGYVTTIRVVAVGATGSSSSAPIRAVGSRAPRGCTWVAGDRTAPTKPRMLRVTRRRASTLALRWSPSTDRSGVCAYRRSRQVRGRWITAGAPIDARLLTTTITGPGRGSSQRIAIQAIDASGNLSPRAEVLARAR